MSRKQTNLTAWDAHERVSAAVEGCFDDASEHYLQGLRYHVAGWLRSVEVALDEARSAASDCEGRR